MSTFGFRDRKEECVQRRHALDGYSSWGRWQMIFSMSPAGNARRGGSGAYLLVSISDVVFML